VVVRDGLLQDALQGCLLRSAPLNRIVCAAANTAGIPMEVVRRGMELTELVRGRQAARLCCEVYGRRASIGGVDPVNRPLPVRILQAPPSVCWL
jgi:hypothetical protein